MNNTPRNTKTPISTPPPAIAVGEVDMKYIADLCGLTPSQRNRVLKEYNRLPESRKILIEGTVAEFVISNKAKKDKTKMSEYYYAMRILAIQDYCKIFFDSSIKCDSEEIDKQRIAFVRQTKQRYKKTTKDDIIRTRIKEIDRLRNEDLSWRGVCDYLKKWGHIDITPSYLRRIYYEIYQIPKK
jgi:hypothetical protein